jgi:hypothetical protein
MEDMARRVRRLERTAVGLALCLCGSLLAGAAQSGKTVDAERFRVLDAKGRVVGVFGVKDGRAVVGCLDTEGRPRVFLGVDEDDTAVVMVRGTAGNTAAMMGAPAGKRPVLHVMDRDGHAVWEAP